jgi:hypothetical protein
VSTARRIAELERERAEQWSALNLATARIHGIDAELRRLKASSAADGDLADGKLTDAVMAVLSASASTMTPALIIARLKERGREESPNKVNATLSYLKQRNRVRNEGRASWQAM